MAIDDAVRQKRFVDAMLDSAPLGFDTTGEEDNRMRQTSGDPDDEAAHEAEMAIQIMREVMPGFWRLHDPDELRKLKQELRANALKRRGVEPEMVTGEPEEVEPDDEAAQEAEEMVRDLVKSDPGFLYLKHNRAERAKLKKAFRANALERMGIVEQKAQQRDPEEEPFDSDKFWNNPDEVQKAVKKVRPPRL